jgi:hypothetical protein
MSKVLLSRRAFVASGLVAGIGTLVGATRFRRSSCDHSSDRAPFPFSGFSCSDHGPHPTPRPGIDASHVLTAGQLKDAALAVPAFDEVRQIPEIVDGIRCHCGCATDKKRYSLLSCYEGDGMAKDCHTCQGQGRMAFRLHSAGKSLAEIREAIDAKYD